MRNPLRAGGGAQQSFSPGDLDMLLGGTPGGGPPGQSAGPSANLAPQAPGGSLTAPPGAPSDAPPELSPASPGGDACAGCADFEASQSVCQKFNGYPVAADQVCAAFTPAAGGPPPEAAEPVVGAGAPPAMGGMFPPPEAR